MTSTFAEIDPAAHSQIKSRVSQIYSMSSMRHLEPMIEDCTKLFMETMSELSDHPVNLGEWLQFYAFDVIGAITFNRRFGFLEERRDISHMIEGLDTGAYYITHVGQLPELHPYILGSAMASKLTNWFPSLKEVDAMQMAREVCRPMSNGYGRKSFPVSLYIAN